MARRSEEERNGLPGSGLSRAGTVSRRAGFYSPSAGPGVAARKHYLEERLDRITSSIFEAGLVLSTAAGAPPDELRKRIDEASRLLDDIVNGIYETMFFSRRPRPEGNGASAVNGTDMP